MKRFFTSTHALRFQRGVRVVLCLLLLSLSSITMHPVQAAGSRDLNAIAIGGYRAFLEYRSDSNGGIPRRTIIKTFANPGETINLGSSAVGLGQGRIEYRPPNVANTSPASSCGAVGLIATLAQEQAGSAPNPGGYTPCTVTVAPDQGGIWEIYFISPNPVTNPANPPSILDPTPIPVTQNWTQPDNVGYVAAWDVTVRNAAGAEIPGRTFANYLALNLGSNARPGVPIGQNSVVFIQTFDGYLYRIGMNSIDPYGFIFFSNSEGFIDNTGRPVFRSIQLPGLNPGAIPPNFSVHNPDTLDNFATNDVTHKLFFQTPSSDLPASAPSPSGQTWLLVAPVPPPTPQNFTFTGIEGTPGQAGTAPLGGNFSFDAASSASYSLIIDLNNDGTFGNGNDRTILGTTVVGRNTVYWDALDGLGVPVPAGPVPYQAQIRVFVGEVHFPLLDPENNPRGIIIERLTTPAGAVNPPDPFLVYYDDSYSYNGTPPYDFSLCAAGETPAPPADAQISPPICYGTPSNPRSALNGVSSQTGAHAWSNNFGDRRGMDTWTYYPSQPVTLSGVIQLREADLAITKTHSPASVPAGDVITYTLTVTNNGPSDVTGAGVSDNVPAQIGDVRWSCAVTAGTGSCGAANGAGNAISTTVNLNANAVATYTVIGRVATTATGTLTNTATVRRPPDVNDPNPNNNTATDTVRIPPGAPPTAITLASFTATRRGSAVRLAWTTTSEINSWGFHLYRSADGSRANAVRVTPEMILAQGRGQGGASYVWADTSVAANQTYTYWLQETETDGGANEYGPVTVQSTALANQNQVFVPLVVR